MTRHPGQFEIEREIKAEEVLGRAKGETPAETVPAVSTPALPAKKPLRRILLVGASLAAIAAGAYYGHDYWTVGRFHVATDDAYVQADNITIAPKISGYLGAVLVGDNETVKAGQVLARIDDRDYKVALEQAKADVAAARATIAAKQATIDAQQSIIDSARATITVDEANQTFAEQENIRYSALATSGYGSVQNQQGAASRIAAARASIVRDTAALAAAVKQVALQKAELAQADAALGHAQAVEDQAELNLGYASIVAPVDGVVGNRTLRVGQYVQAGTQLMSVVPSDGAYVVGNFKETQLTDVRRGQPVEIDVDMFPGRSFHGHVDSLAPASGQTFALLPPDNATGNFTKVVQRIPVKITLDGGNARSSDLRPGMSVTPSIDTKQAPAAKQANAD
ncbi:HlyD family secretion protein [Lichenifustis flavocetrariae]|uniref:HlyD family secretion protein n=1 Tax=Lichenifustis flavocetrariae TaxID=2949735 RepID=A0AA41YXF9_9HYPH|nr:HlyD family secretion protein [Lichenifustis flavocetrariae]MCW6508788.1 HlyD family secretion protein [Lichenifustis flavocetrariae]